MRIEQDKVINITDEGCCIPEQGFTVRDTREDILVEEKQENKQFDVSPQVIKFLKRIEKTLEIRKRINTSG